MKARWIKLSYLLFTFSLLVSSYVSALGTGVSPIDGGIQIISNLFNMQSLANNEYVQIGFLKFALFVVLFAVSFSILTNVKGIFGKEGQGRRTAMIVSLAFSAIGIFLMPEKWLLATGGMITTVMSSIVFLGFFWGGAYFAVAKLKCGEKDEFGWIKNLIGFLLILLLIMMLELWARLVGIPVQGRVGGTFVIQAYSVLISWTYLVLAVFLLVKLVQMAMCVGAGINSDKKPEKEPEKKPTPEEEQPDYSKSLAEIEKTLDEYDLLFQHHKGRSDAVLQIHHVHVRGGSYGGGYGGMPDVTSAQMLALISSYNELQTKADAANLLFNQLMNHENFNKIKDDQKKSLVNSQLRHTNQLQRTKELRDDFIKRYARGEAPA